MLSSEIESMSSSLTAVSAKLALWAGVSTVAGGGVEVAVKAAEKADSEIIAQGAHLLQTQIWIFTVSEYFQILAALCVFCNLVVFAMKFGRWCKATYFDIKEWSAEKSKPKKQFDVSIMGANPGGGPGSGSSSSSSSSGGGSSPREEEQEKQE